jgi:hypothetical protein
LVAHQREHQIRLLLQRRFAKLVRRKSAAAVVSEVGANAAANCSSAASTSSTGTPCLSSA